MKVLAALLLFLVAPARAASVRLALIEDSPFRLSGNLDEPLQRVFKLSPSSGSIDDIQVIPGYYSESDYRFRVSRDQPVESMNIPAAVFETPSESLIIYPPVPSLLQELRLRAADPSSYKSLWSVALSSRPVTISQVRGPEGEALLSILLDPKEETARWRSTAALLYRARWQDQDVEIILTGKIFGGLNPLAARLAAAKSKGPLVGLSRGGNFFSFVPELQGAALAQALEKLGLSYSAVSYSEIRRWSVLQAYRAQRPDGIQFLSANLVYSTAPAQTLMPPYAIVESGGLRLALIGLTSPLAAKFLGAAGLDDAKIEDPREALERVLPSVRAQADAVVALGDFDADWKNDLGEIHGVDLIIGDPRRLPAGFSPPDESVTQTGRQPFSPPLAALPAYDGSLNIYALGISSSAHGTDWIVKQQSELLDALEGSATFPEFDPRAFGISLSTEPALLPAARRIHPDSPELTPTFSPWDFWTLASGILATETDSEAGLLRVSNLYVNTSGDIKEGVARVWLHSEEPAIAVWLKGSELKPLLAEARRQRDADERSESVGGKPRIAAGGFTPGPRIHGSPVENDVLYRVAMSRVLADALNLTADHMVKPLGKTVDEIVLAGLRRRAGSPASDYRSWSQGAPVDEPGLWRLNFRDVGLNLQNTTVVRDDAFNDVPNSRIQGFNELLIGGVAKTDADYLKSDYKWSNTLELEYAKSRLRPRDQPPVVNTSANRISLLTTGTRRLGAVPQKWLANSWGPSLGFEYDGQFEASPGLRRKNIYSAFPGVQFYDGTWVRSMEISANVKRDLSRDPPNTQLGLHTRWLLTHGFSTGATLSGELYANYFFLTRSDTDQDLRVEGDANLKLRFPIRKYLWIAPFVDYYLFALKVRPLWGYNAMTGVQIGFSRLWKPQYERF